MKRHQTINFSPLKANRVKNKVFGDIVGVSDISVNRRKAGVCVPNLNLLSKMCEIMGVTIKEILDINRGL